MSLARGSASPLPSGRSQTWYGNPGVALFVPLNHQMSLARGCASPLPSGKSRAWFSNTGVTLFVSLALLDFPILPPWGHFSPSLSLPAPSVLCPGAELSDFGEETPRKSTFPPLAAPPGPSRRGLGEARSGLYPANTFPEPQNWKQPAKKRKNTRTELLLFLTRENFTEQSTRNVYSRPLLSRDWGGRLV